MSHDDMRGDIAELRKVLDELDRSRFRPKERRAAERREWFRERAFLLYATCFWFNSLMTTFAGFAALLNPCHVDGPAQWWMYASAWITGGLVFAPLLVAMAGLRLPGD